MSQRKLADRRGLYRPDINRSSAPSGQGISCESGHDRLGDREAGKGESDSEGVEGFRWGRFRVVARRAFRCDNSQGNDMKV